MEEDRKYVQVKPAKPDEADGEWVKLAGRKEYLLPPLNFKALRAMQGDLVALGSVADGNAATLTQEKMDTVIKIVHAALVRNYPDIQVSDVEELVDMANFRQVFSVLLGMSGLVRGPAPGKEGSAPAP